MRPLATSKYSKEQIMDMLHARYKTRNVRFRYDLLNKDLLKIGTLQFVESASIEYGAFNEVKRTASFTIKEVPLGERVEQNPKDVFYNYGETTNRPFTDWTKQETTYPLPSISDNEMYLNSPQNYLSNGNFHNWSEESAMPVGWVTLGEVASIERDPGLSTIGQGIKINKTMTFDSTAGIQWHDEPLAASGGEKLYISGYSLYTSLDNVGTGNRTNNIGVLSSKGSLYNATIIETEEINLIGWRWTVAEVTIPAGTTSDNYGMFWTMTTSSSNSGIHFCSLYFGKEKPVRKASAYSPELTVNYQNEIGTNSPNINRITIMYDRVKDTKNPLATEYPSAPPPPEVRSIVQASVWDGTSWGEWYDVPPRGYIPNPFNKVWTADKVKIRMRVYIDRYDSNIRSSISNLSVRVTYDIDQWVTGGDEINYLEDRIQPFIEFEMPNGDWVDYPLGVFVLNSPTRQDKTDGVYRTISAYDQLVILKEDAFVDTEYILGNVVEDVRRILRDSGFSRINIPNSSSVSDGIALKIGANKLTSINSVLNGIGYEALWVDANGVVISRPNTKSADNPTEYSYIDDDLSVTFKEMSYEEDMYDTANAWVAVRLNDVDGGAPLTSTYVNDSADSPTSTINLGRRKVDYREIDHVSTQEDIDNYVMMLADNANKLYGKVEFETAIMPMHEHLDNIYIRYNPLDIDGVYQETGWSMDLKAGAKMKHQARKVVRI